MNSRQGSASRPNDARPRLPFQAAWRLKFYRALNAVESWAPGSGGTTVGTPAKEVLINNRYRLVQMLGEGGMGRVWLADDTVERRQVALKEMHLEASARNAAADIAFKREFYTMTKLVHPNTVRVYDYGVLESGDRFLTMEAVRGEDLRTRIERKQVKPSEVIDVLISMAQVLGFIHSRYYVHCDIKSENIRITTQGAVKLMDFGLMHQLGLPSQGMLKGTPHYMAPEIPKGGAIDARTDLYSLGVLAFEMSTGRFPFEGKTLVEILDAHLNRPVPDLTQEADIAPGLRPIIEKLLAKEPRDRIQTAGELLRLLGEASGRRIGSEDYGVRASYLNCAELVGRESEQAALKLQVRALQEQRGGALFVTAPAGVGKTRLLQEFRLQTQLEEIPFFVGQCRAEGQAPMVPLAEALAPLVTHTHREFLAKFGPVLARFVPALRAAGHVPLASVDPLADKAANFEALGLWLKDVSDATPFVLCIEDLHWADAATIEYLNAAIRSLAQTRGMVLGTFRSNEVDRLSALFQTVDAGLTQRMELTPLSLQSVGTLVKTMLGDQSLPEGLAARLFEVTQGNAFFVTESMRAFIEQGALALVDGKWHLSQPPDALSFFSSINEAVSSRLKTLEGATLAFCRRIAPIGRLLDLPVVRAATALQDDSLFAALDALVERQFIQKNNDSYYFSHDTVREAIYQSTPELELRSAHQAVAEALEKISQSNPGILGYHFARGDDRMKAIKYILEDADQAQKANLLLRTAQKLSEAAELVESADYPKKVNTLIGLWARLIEVGSTGHTPTCVKYADKLLPLWERRLDVKKGAEAFHAETHRLARLPKFLARGRIQKLWSDQPLDPDSRDPLHIVPKLFAYRTLQSFSLSSIGEDERVLKVSDRQFADNPQPGPYRATAFTCKAIYLMHTGQLQAVGEGGRLAKTWHEEHLRTVGFMPRLLWRDYAWSHHFTILQQAMSGEPLDESIWKQGIALCRERRFSDIEWFLTASRGIHAALGGHALEMQATYDQLVDMMRQMGNPQMADSRLPIWVGLYWIQRLEREQAEAACAKIESWQRRLPTDHWMRRYAATFRALFDGQFAELAKADKSLEDALSVCGDVQSFRLRAQLLSARADVKSRMGHVDAARQYSTEALAIATDPVTRTAWDHTVALRASAVAHGGPEGIAKALQAATIAEKQGLTLHCALALTVAGRLGHESRPAEAAGWRQAGRALLSKEGAKALLENDDQRFCTTVGRLVV